MNCSYCGTSVLAEHEFCRACGISLAKNEPRLVRPQPWGLGMLMLMFGGITIAITGKMLDLRWLTFTGVFICMGGMFAMAAFAMYRQSGPQKRRIPKVPETEMSFRAEPTNKLLPFGENDSIQSVTENTTNLLKTPVEIGQKKR